MAAPRLRVVRGDVKPSPRRRALVAASQPIPDPTKHFSRTAGRAAANTEWQEDAWQFLDAVGELRYYVEWRAASCSKVRIIASELDDDGLPSGGIDQDDATSRAVAEIVKQMGGGPLGMAQVMRRSAECITVVGEVWIVILRRPSIDGGVTPGPILWLAVSGDEIKKSNRGTKIDLPDGTEHEFVKNVDVMFRIWKPRPRKAREPDSPVRAAFGALRTIVRTEKKMRNADKSRLIGNGILFVPHEMSLPANNGPVSEDDDETEPLMGEPAVQQLTDLLFDQADTALDNEDSMAAFIPLMAGVPGEQIKNVQHIKFDNDVDEVELKKLEAAFIRLARSLDVSPERLTGMGDGTNHWSSHQIGDEDVQTHIAPVVELVCEAFTRTILAPVLIGKKIDPTKYLVWYDASGLTVDPDKTEEAKDAREKGAITSAALRKYYKLAEEDGYDLTTIEGLQVWAMDKIAEDPALITTLAPLIPAAEGIEFPTPAAIEQKPEDDEDDPEKDGTDEPDTERDSGESTTSRTASMYGLDAVGQSMVEVYAERCFELVGKRLRTRANHDKLRTVPLTMTHRVLDPVTPERAAELIDGWDRSMPKGALIRLGLNPETIKAVVRDVAITELTRTVIDAEVG